MNCLNCSHWLWQLSWRAQWSLRRKKQATFIRIEIQNQRWCGFFLPFEYLTDRSCNAEHLVWSKEIASKLFFLLSSSFCFSSCDVIDHCRDLRHRFGALVGLKRAQARPQNPDKTLVSDQWLVAKCFSHCKRGNSTTRRKCFENSFGLIKTLFETRWA